uniref:Uncharacterized protein n=1 Tax=Geospiza parvula TaxID=87175 RepID=A0A8U8B1W9_GEOPR
HWVSKPTKAELQQVEGTPEVKKFMTWDYIIFAALFLVSASIGVFFAVKERKKKNSKEFLVGGRQMTCGPIAFSLTSSFMSAVTVLGTPSEVYRYGASFVLFFLSYTLVIIFTSELFLPVFYRSGITSTYERKIFDRKLSAVFYRTNILIK